LKRRRLYLGRNSTRENVKKTIGKYEKMYKKDLSETYSSEPLFSKYNELQSVDMMD
jgi:hypothetical protein